MQKTHIAVITGTRAEYGLLRPVIKKLLKDGEIILSVIVTGAHLSEAHGNTITELEADGIPIAARIPILTHGTDALALPDTVADALSQFARWFGAHQPDVALVLGDRYEMFAATQAAAMMGVPVAHISGGDLTLGAADDYYRHCITKMAHLHFPSCAQYAKRVTQLGEAPETVHNVGGLGDQNIREMPKLTRAELSQSLDFDLENTPYALVTFHPETAGQASPEAQMQAFLAAMSAFANAHDIRWLITKANADAGGEVINKMIDAWVAAHTGKAIAFTSLGVKRYLSAMQYAAFVAGNSSSGVVETPSFGVPTLNIGARQSGRIICDNVLCCAAQTEEILTAFETLTRADFVAKAKQTISPYNGGDTAGKIVATLKAALHNPNFGKPKGFYDL